MARLHIAFAIAVPFLFANCAKAQTVAPGQLYTGPLLTFRAPTSEGWRVLRSSNVGMAFIRAGDFSFESYVAQVAIFALPESTQRDEFVALVKQGVEKDYSKRFMSIEATYAYTEERGYPCVRVKALAEDTKAARPAVVENLKLQMHALYCRHPGRPNTGFSILFSYRGASLDAALDIPAQTFIAGVQPSKN